LIENQSCKTVGQKSLIVLNELFLKVQGMPKDLIRFLPPFKKRQACQKF